MIDNNKYELTDARIDKIITSSLSRLSQLTVNAVSSIEPNSSQNQRSGPTLKNISLYKKYGDGDGDDNDNGDATPVHTPVHTPSSTKSAGSKMSCLDVKFFPPTANQLFWCFYIAHNGMFAYDTMGNSFVAENAFKYATIDHIRANMPHVKSRFKRYRMSLPNFEAELVTSKVLSLSALLGLAMCYDRNILYIDNRKYFEMNATGYVASADPDAGAVANLELEPLAFTVIEKVKNQFCVFSVAEENAVAFATDLRRVCRDTFWKMESITTPLKSLSYYTVADLHNIYARLSIVNNHTTHLQKKMTKSELYAAIAQNI
jgi:hypothetical protein